MCRIFMVITTLLCLTAVSAAQASVGTDQALRLAIEDINSRLGTNYTYNGGQVAFQFREERIDGDNLGCPTVEATNQNSYLVTITQFDINFDNMYEWEHRFAVESDGSIRMVLCRAPSADVGEPTAFPTQVSTPTATSTVTPATDGTLAPTVTGTVPPVIFGRDGPRVLTPILCDSLLTRLVNGSTARVIPGGASNNLRAETGLTGTRIGELAAGTVFQVQDGPFCADEIAWVLVAVDGVVRGWTAEGTNGDYFLEPMLTDAAVITPVNAPNLRAVGGVVAPGTLAMTQSYQAAFATLDEDTATVWSIPGGTFTTLDDAQWSAEKELPGTFSFVHRDYSGRVWVGTTADGTFSLTSPDAPQIQPLSVPAGSERPVVAMDVEGNFVAIVGADPNSFTLFSLNREGGPHTEELSATLDSPVRDLLFRPDGIGLYAVSDTQIVSFPFQLGEGWLSQPTITTTHDLSNPQLAVTLGGARVAMTGTNTEGNPALRVFTEEGFEFGVATLLTQVIALDSDTAGAWSRPSFNIDGSLVTFTTDAGTLRLIDAVTGQGVIEIQSGGFGPVAFSVDGLILAAPAANGQVQVYGVALNEPAG